MNKKLLAMLLALAMSLLCGCLPEQPTDGSSQQVIETTITTEVEETTVSTEETTETTETTAAQTTTVTTSTTVIETETGPLSQPKEFSLAEIPQFSGNAYVEVNNNIPYFTDTTSTEAFETYSPLDDLGRCGVAFANICPEIMPTEERGEIGMVKPSGWQTVKYNGVIDGNYLYNRCHLIAYELAAENANTQNLITGTRYLNIQGMLRFENRVADYVHESGNHVLYRVTPIFVGNNLVASGVLMEGYSVEDQGKGIQYCVYCYNVQPNIIINYANGESSLDPAFTTEPEVTSPTVTQPPATQPPVVVQPPQQSGSTYVLNTNTKKFHYPDCSSVDSMSEKNKSVYTGTRDEVIAMGYDPCKRCNP